MRVDPVRRSLVIYRVPNAELDAAVRARLSATNVDFADARWTAAHMDELSDKVMADRGYWRDRGVAVNGAGPIYDGSAVEVMIDGAPGRHQTAFDERYGPHAVKLVTGSAIPIPGNRYRPSGTSLSEQVIRHAGEGVLEDDPFTGDRHPWKVMMLIGLFSFALLRPSS
jgi:hypothetical protein